MVGLHIQNLSSPESDQGSDFTVPKPLDVAAGGTRHRVAVWRGLIIFLEKKREQACLAAPHRAVDARVK
jgi:hypothetical protein